MNLIMNGGANDISNGGAPLTINFDIQQNNVSNNGINGITVAATANAVFRPIITDNIIENNGQDGINASTLYFAQLAGHVVEQHHREQRPRRHSLHRRRRKRPKLQRHRWPTTSSRITSPTVSSTRPSKRFPWAAATAPSTSTTT